jgi:hypothetical protein
MASPVHSGLVHLCPVNKRQWNLFGGETMAIKAINPVSGKVFASMGHRQIQNTTKYAQLSPNAFKDFWKD